MRKSLGLTTKEIALISLFSAIWVVSQMSLGALIGQITHVHGVINRVVGWLLMFLMVELTDRFGRVTLMATIAALVTRALRHSGTLYALSLGLGYALAGLIFDALIFMKPMRGFRGERRNAYLLLISLVSGVVALLPYIALKFYTLGLYGFLIFIPKLAYSLAKGTILSLLGTIIGLSVIPKISEWKRRIQS